MANKALDIETDHSDMIHDAQLNYYGTLLATASSDHTIKIFRVEQNKYEFQQTLAGHEGPVWQVRWIHPNFAPYTLVSCGYDRRIIVWAEDQQGYYQKAYESDDIHQSSVNSVDVAPLEYGLMIVAGSSDGNISVYWHDRSISKPTWKCQIQAAHQGGVNGVSWCKSVTPGESKRTFVTCGCDMAVCIWDFDPQKGEISKVKELKGHRDWVRDVAWAPAPAQASTGVIASCSEDNTVIIWTYRRGKGWEQKTELKCGKRVWSVSWSVMGNILAVAQGEEDVLLFKEGHDGNWNTVES